MLRPNVFGLFALPLFFDPVRETAPPDPAAVVVAAVPAPDRHGPFTCGYCGVQNTRRGEIVRMSDHAREMNDREEEIRRLKRELAQLRADLEAAETARAGIQRELEATTRLLTPEKKRDPLRSSLTG